MLTLVTNLFYAMNGPHILVMPIVLESLTAPSPFGSKYPGLGSKL
jgi:hypothetical protein